MNFEFLSMQTATLRSLQIATLPFSGNPNRRNVGSGQRARRRSSTAVFASKRDADGRDYNGGRLVDENMIMLRMRIREMRAAEAGCEPETPCDWAAWEKKYVREGGYESDICSAMEWLQSSLMEARPGLALGAVALVVLSVPAATAAVGFHLMEVVKGILSGILLG